MASKVLVPAPPFSKLQVKKFVTGGGEGVSSVSSSDANCNGARVAHLEHSVRFLQEQHRLMLSGLHSEIEDLRERNRDLQFQLIFNKESKTNSPISLEGGESTVEETRLRREVCRLEREAAEARAEAGAAEARALCLQQSLDELTEKVRVLDLSSTCKSCGRSENREVGGGGEPVGVDGGESGGEAEIEESRGELRARLADAEKLVRRLRSDAERQRREVLAGGVTNLLFDGAAAQVAHLQCMKNSLRASLRADPSLTGGNLAGYHNNYSFPPVHTPEFWREPIREDYLINGRGRNRRPIILPELAATGHQIHRSTVYVNNHARQRGNGYEQNSKNRRSMANDELNSRYSEDSGVRETNDVGGGRARGRRHHHRKTTSTDHI